MSGQGDWPGGASLRDARARLLAEIVEETRATERYTGRPALAERVLEALGRVPREAFVPDSVSGLAYVNAPLGIGHGQTISQPFIVALMTDLLDLPEAPRVLDVGTGSGYQAAVLAELGAEVFGVELIDALAEAASARLRRLGYDRVRVRCGDGHGGWPEHAPYDGIVVGAAAEEIPAALVDQLAPGAALVIPVGPAHGPQRLVRVWRDLAGRLEEHTVLPVAFVPLVHPGRRRAGQGDAQG